MIFYYIYMGVLPSRLFMYHMCALRCQEKVLDPLEL